jgi:AbiJ N-terminal domain 4
MDNLLYSKRKKMIEQVNQLEVYKYDHLPIQFKNQVIYIWESTISVYLNFATPDNWSLIHNYLIEQWGCDSRLKSNRQTTSFENCCNYLRNEKITIDQELDLIELTFRFVENIWGKMGRVNQLNLQYVCQSADSAVDKLNDRFREHSIGYQYTNGQIMRVDSGFIHAEVVIPALTLLSNQGFSGAEQEFRVAHKYYREQEYKEALGNASKAFESTIKTICERLDWDYKENDTARELIARIVKKELIPKYHQESLHALKRLLESVSTPRNKEAGHGQGEDVKNVPAYLAGYALHITASSIIFLVEAYKDKQSS